MKHITLPVMAVLLIFGATNKVDAKTKADLKKELREIASGYSFSFSGVKFYFKPGGAMYNSRKKGVRYNWGVKYFAKRQQMAVCYSVEELRATVEITRTYCGTKSELLRARKGKGDIFGLSKR